jgi:hypothetical protein
LCVCVGGFGDGDLIRPHLTVDVDS